MRGDPRIIAAINANIVAELTAIDQYSAHLAYVALWKYPRLAKYLKKRIKDETGHYKLLRSWVISLGGKPVSGSVNRTNVGDEVPLMLSYDKTGEELAISNYQELIALCLELKDSQTRKLIERILKDETGHLRDQEAQLTQVKQMGINNYLSAKL